MARGHHTSHHGKHHVSHAHHEKAMVHHHHHARGGAAGEYDREAESGKYDDKDTDKLDYTAESNVVPEAEGKRRKLGGRAKHAHGGTVHHGKHHVSHAHHEPAVVVHQHRKRGGETKHVEGEGHKGRYRMDRPGRKRGGGVGADMTPLSSAARTHEAEAHKADNDELSR